MVRLTLTTLCILGLFASAANASSYRQCYETGHVELVLDLEIGGEEADDASILYKPSALAVDRTGCIFVLDYEVPCIKKFDPIGRHIATFSRRGEGPGDLRIPTDIAVIGNGEVVVYDAGSHRLTFFDNDGKYIRDYGYEKEVSRIRGLGERTLVMELRDNDPYFSEEGTHISIVVAPMDLTSEVVIDSMTVIDQVTLRRDGRVIGQASVPFAADLLWDVGPLGTVVTVNSGTYEVGVYSDRGVRIRSWTHRMEAVSVSSAEKEVYFRRIERRHGPQFVRSVLESIVVPDVKPFVRSLHCDPAGYILAGLMRHEGEAPRYDIFDPKGHFVASCRAERLTKDAVLTDPFVYDLRQSQDDLPTVGRFRLECGLR